MRLKGAEHLGLLAACGRFESSEPGTSEAGSMGPPAWHAFRVLSSPPRIHAQPEISRQLLSTPELAAFVAHAPASGDSRFGHEVILAP